MRDRAISAAVLVPVVVGAVAAGGLVLVAALAAAAAVAAHETYRLLRAAGYPSLHWLGIALAAVLVAEGGLRALPDASGLLLFAVGAILVAVGAFARPDPRDGLVTWMATVFGAGYVGLLGFVLRPGVVAPDLPAGAILARLGTERAWLVLLVAAVWAYDTGAYLVGRQFGRTRFLVHLSPSKTYAGLVGGLAASTAATIVGLGLLGRPLVDGLLLGPLLGLAAQAGDLAESMLKRAAGAKDSGTLIPGHGGILDRIDSFLFAGPVVALYVATVVG